MASGVYGAVERSRLSMAAEQLELYTQLADPARALADKFRQFLPDLDDVTIGRVIIALTTDVAASLFLAIPAPPGNESGRALDSRTVWQVLMRVGLELTEPEWKVENSEQ